MTPPAGRPHVLVVGLSTRAIADSAARAGFEVTSIDAYADLDQHSAVHALCVTPEFSAEAAVRVAQQVNCDAVVYLSSFENHPDHLRELTRGRHLWGNPPHTMRAVRTPHLLARALADHHLPSPSLKPEASQGAWLLKPLDSGGGMRIRRWESGASVPEGYYVQEFIDGEPGSLTFVASAEGVRLLGVSRQLVGMHAFGASGFRYCGNILDGDVGAGSWLVEMAGAIAAAVAAAFSLRGVNGIDFVAQDNRLYPVEVNPRWSASIELVERARGISAFAAHAGACARNELPSFNAMTAAPIGRSIGKAVVFSRHDVTVGDTRDWCSRRDIRDVPRPSTVIRTGDPVCTVFAEGESPDVCLAELETRAAWVYDELRGWARP